MWVSSEMPQRKIDREREKGEEKGDGDGEEKENGDDEEKVLEKEEGGTIADRVRNDPRNRKPLEKELGVTCIRKVSTLSS